MGIVREHINEKFVKDSDPIQDMGIGIIKILPTCVELLFKADIESGALCSDTPGCINYVEIVNSTFNIHYYGEEILIKDIKQNKKQYFINLLKSINILCCFEDTMIERPYIFVFKIKDELVKYFEQGRKDEWDYRRKHGLI